MARERKAKAEITNPPPATVSTKEIIAEPTPPAPSLVAPLDKPKTLADIESINLNKPMSLEDFYKATHREQFPR